MSGPVPRAMRARSFDAWAADYDRYRPSYPAALFDLIADRLALPERPRVADIGAGTGKASMAMAARGWQVTAVEPGEPMLAVLRERAAAAGRSIETVVGSAEATTLPSATFDLATAAEAYHWFDAPRALREIARILRGGGGLACFWNVRDVDASPLLAGYDELAQIVGAEPADLARPGPREQTRHEILETGCFEEPSFEQVRHAVEMSGEEFIGLAFTKSHVRTSSRSVQARFRRELKALLERHGVARSTPISVPYVVDCWIARRTTVNG